MNMNKMYYATWLDAVMRALIVIGAFNWGLIGFFDFNVVEWISDKMPFEYLDIVVYCFVGISALFYFFARDYYLPFLGRSVYPCGSLVQKVPDNADVNVSVKVNPGVNVIYWAAEEGDKVMADPWVAYSQYSNAGVVRSDQNGDAVLRIRRPAAYKIPSITGRTLNPHVHFRTCDTDGMLSRVQTVYVDEAQLKK